MLIPSILSAIAGAASLAAAPGHQTAQLTEIKIKDQDPLAILGGKLLAYTICTEDQMASSPPGKWANVFGFTYFRYAERGSGKEKASLNGLISRMANGAADIMGPEDVQTMVSALEGQSRLEAKATEQRSAISRELFKWREGKGDPAKVLALAEENGGLLADLLEVRMGVYGPIYDGLSELQRADLVRLREGGLGEASKDVIRSATDSREARQELNLMCGKFVTWATGTPSMSELIDAGRPAVFFGFAALRMGNRASEKQSTSLRRDASRVMLAALNGEQSAALHQLAKDQGPHFEEYMKTRGMVARLLNPQRRGAASDADGGEVSPGVDSHVSPQVSGAIDWDEIRALCIRGEVAEARLGLLQAERMGAIVRSLGEEQRASMAGFAAPPLEPGVDKERRGRRGKEKRERSKGAGDHKSPESNR